MLNQEEYMMKNQAMRQAMNQAWQEKHPNRNTVRRNTTPAMSRKELARKRQIEYLMGLSVYRLGVMLKDAELSKEELTLRHIVLKDRLEEIVLRAYDVEDMGCVVPWDKQGEIAVKPSQSVLGRINNAFQDTKHERRRINREIVRTKHTIKNIHHVLGVKRKQKQVKHTAEMKRIQS